MLPALPLMREGKGAQARLPGRRASMLVTTMRSEGAVTRVLRRRNNSFPCRRWLGCDLSSWVGLDGSPHQEAPCCPLWGPLLLHGLRPAAKHVTPLSLCLTFLPSVFATESRTGRPTRFPLLSPSGALDRLEGNFRRSEGWK